MSGNDPNICPDCYDPKDPREPYCSPCIADRPALTDQLTAARGWLALCEWRDAPDFDSMSAGMVWRGIARHYAGGIAQFIADGETAFGDES